MTMWYPTLPDVLGLYEQICEAHNDSAQVTDMAAVDEAILGPQRTGDEERSRDALARKATSFLFPLLHHRPFESHSERVAFSTLQRFANRNGFVLQTTSDEMTDRLESALRDEDPDEAASWLQSHLSTRFDASHTDRIYGALDTLATVKEDLERSVGFHEEVERIDRVGHVIGRQIAALFQLDPASRRQIKDRFPVFAEAWGEAFEPDP